MRCGSTADDYILLNASITSVDAGMQGGERGKENEELVGASLAPYNVCLQTGDVNSQIQR